MTTLGEVFDWGDPEPSDVLVVESLAWVDITGYGAELCDVKDAYAHDPELTALSFGKTATNGWKFWLNDKNYIGWDELVRRFRPVQVTMLDGAS